MKPAKVIQKIQYFLNREYSYSQYGEDNIILAMLGLYKIKNPNYIDIGAHHPFKYSNTALLYWRGIVGINIEPDPILFKRFIKYRKKDINLNIGISDERGESILYQLERPEFNTFSVSAANTVEEKGIRRVGETKINVDTYNSIVERYLNGKAPDILFLDAEGFDEVILGSIDFKKYCPKIICIETYAYGVGKKNNSMINFLLNKEYSIHADTFVNTIFINKNLVQSVIS